MGYSISWLAVKGKSQEVLCEELGLSPSGEMTEYGDAPIAGRTIQDGWYLIVFDRCEHALLGAKSLTSISQSCDVVACSVEEHIMVCTAELWRNGEQIWHIEHDAQDSFDHIKTTGQLPEHYAAIKEANAAEQESAGGKQADVDYFFEIPVEIAKHLVGFRHDESEFEEDGFEELKQMTSSPRSRPNAAPDSVQRIAMPKSKPWWQFW